MENKVTILGTRGSVPVSGRAFMRYGCATTCFLIQMGGEAVVVDAGTGILNLPDEVMALPRLTMLLTHPHVDHLLGLPMCPYLFQKDVVLQLFAASLAGIDTRAQVSALLSPPLWPVGPEMLPGTLRFHALPEKLCQGNILVESMQGAHPGGVTVFRLSCGEKRVVIATDCTITDDLKPVLADFARDCDLFLCDGQYSDEEWPLRCEFGHSTWRAAAELAQVAGAKEARIVHHDPNHVDEVLDAAAPELLQLHPRCCFAREGEVIPI